MIKTFTDSRNSRFKPVTREECNRELEEADAEIESRRFGNT
ncbi:MAG: hypothetical protein WKG06_32080 [Segetibacter sp.]